MLGKGERKRGAGETRLTSRRSSAKKGSLELAQELEGAFNGRGRAPRVAESGSELRRRSNPERDRGEVALVAGICDKGEGDRKVVREGPAGTRGDGAEVGRMVENGGRGRGERVEEERGGDEKAVEARRIGEGGGGIAGDMEIGVLVMRDLSNREVGFERGERGGEGSGREGRRGVGGVVDLLDEVKVTSEEGGKRSIDGKKRVNKLGLDKGFVGASFEVNIEKLESLVSDRLREVSTELDVSAATRREGDVCARIELGDGWGVNNEGASDVHREVVEGDGTAREGGEGKLLRSGEVSLLKTDNITLDNKVAESRRDDRAAKTTIRASGVVRKAVDIVGDDAGDEGGRGGKGGERRREGEGNERGRRGESRKRGRGEGRGRSRRREGRRREREGSGGTREEGEGRRSGKA